MKKGLKREVFWLLVVSAPLMVFAVFQFRTANSETPTFRLESGSPDVKWFSPLERAYEGHDDFCEIKAEVRAWSSVAPSLSSAPKSVGIEVSDYQGRTVSKIIKASSAEAWPLNKDSDRSCGGSELNDSESCQLISWKFPINSIGKTRGTLPFRGRIGWNRIASVTVETELRPLWLNAQTKRLRLRKVVWHPDAKGRRSGRIEVELFVSPGTVLDVSRFQPDIPAQNRWGMLPQSESNPVKAQLLLMWSPRVEADNGKWNSLAEIRRWMDAASEQTFAPETIEGLASGFRPLIEGASAVSGEHFLRVSYRIREVPTTRKNPVFKTDIGVVGDGFLPVEIPLRW